VVLEVLSPSTRILDERTKLPEYVALDGVEAVLLVDTAVERVRLVERLAADDWRDQLLPAGAAIPIKCLNLTVPAEEIFPAA
jgi:Uma2 family endonuclease